MAEYIERQAAIDLFYPVDPENDGSDGCTVVYKTENYTSDEIEAVISGLPAADVALVRHGRWIGLEYDGYADGAPVYDLWECAECGEEVRGDDVPDTHPWCHGCGAQMDADKRPAEEG